MLCLMYHLNRVCPAWWDLIISLFIFWLSLHEVDGYFTSLLVYVLIMFGLGPRISDALLDLLKKESNQDYTTGLELDNGSPTSFVFVRYMNYSINEHCELGWMTKLFGPTRLWNNQADSLRLVFSMSPLERIHA